MNQQAWEQEADPDGRIRYVAVFLPAAWNGVSSMFTQPRCRVESFGLDGEGVVHATTVVAYRGQQYRFRRQVWPAAHPAQLAAQLYTTSLEERLNTGRFHSGEGEIVDL